MIAKKIIDKKLSVRQAENLVKLFKHTKKIKLITKDSNLINLEESLQNKIGIRAFIRNKRNNSGRVSFEYKDLDQLNRLIDVIKNKLLDLILLFNIKSEIIFNELEEFFFN